MARRPLEDRHIRKLIDLGDSTGVTIPIEFIRALKWRKKQKVVIEKKGSALIISDWNK
jgi:antitoxin component of MazEF toxin-antitoxin module